MIYAVAIAALFWATAIAVCGTALWRAQVLQTANDQLEAILAAQAQRAAIGSECGACSSCGRALRGDALDDAICDRTMRRRRHAVTFQLGLVCSPCANLLAIGYENGKVPE
jgi:hypothetical protein